MLPHSYEYPRDPPMLIERNQAPPYPDYSDARVRPVLLDIAVAIVNKTVIESGRNPIRMFAYNLLSENRWQNTAFETVFKYCALMLSSALDRNNGTTPAQALYENIVSSILSFWVSTLIYDYPELQSVISPQMINHCSQNAGKFHAIKTEMNQMQQGGFVHNYPPPNVPQQPQYGNYGPMMMQAPPTAQCVWNPQTGQWVPVQNPQVGGVAPMYPGTGMQVAQRPAFRIPDYAPRPNMDLTRTYDTSTPTQTDRYFSETPIAQPVSEINEFGNYDRHRFSSEKPTINQTEYFNRQKTQQDTTSTDRHIPIETSYELVTTSKTGDTSVDRKQHEIIDPVPVVELVQKEVQEEFIEEPPIHVNIVKQPECDLGLNSPIGQLRADWVKSKDFARRYCLIADVIISTIDIGRFYDKYVDGATLTAIAINLQAILATLTKLAKHDPHAKAELTVLREIDNKITKKVNDFLTDVLEIKVTIESFITDYPDLPGYVLKKVGGYGSEAFTRFDEDLVQVLTASFGKFADKNIDVIEVPEGVHIAYIPNLYTITFIPFDRVDLGLPADQQKFIIDPSIHKVLYQAVKDLFIPDNPDNEFNCPVEKHVLITSDGVRYYARETLEQDGFYLKKI